MLHLSLTARVTSSRSVHHEARIDTLSLVWAHPPTITLFSMSYFSSFLHVWLCSSWTNIDHTIQQQMLPAYCQPVKHAVLYQSRGFFFYFWGHARLWNNDLENLTHCLNKGFDHAFLHTFLNVTGLLSWRPPCIVTNRHSLLAPWVLHATVVRWSVIRLLSPYQSATFYKPIGQ